MPYYSIQPTTDSAAYWKPCHATNVQRFQAEAAEPQVSAAILAVSFYINTRPLTVQGYQAVVILISVCSGSRAVRLSN